MAKVKLQSSGFANRVLNCDCILTKEEEKMATKLETQIAMMQDELELNRQSVMFAEALADQYRKEKILPSYQSWRS